MLVFKVLEILFLEALVLEELIWLLLEIFADGALHGIDNLLVNIASEDVTVHLFNELDKTAEHLFVNCIRVGVRLYFLKHLIVGLPVVLERRVVLNDQIDDVEVCQNGA